jgi:hypothetical protein
MRKQKIEYEPTMDAALAAWLAAAKAMASRRSKGTLADWLPSLAPIVKEVRADGHIYGRDGQRTQRTRGPRLSQPSCARLTPHLLASCEVETADAAGVATPIEIQLWPKEIGADDQMLGDKGYDSQAVRQDKITRRANRGDR